LSILSERDVIGTIVVDGTGCVLDINDYYLGILGYTRADFKKNGLNLHDITPTSEAEPGAFRCEMETHGKIECVERTRLRKDGTLVWILTGYVKVRRRP